MSSIENSGRSHIPRVSIGMPVYNSEKYIEQAIESILAQTFRDFELIISDNASTDRTPQICEHYATLDPRIRYRRNSSNLGPAENHNSTFRQSKGEYFRWAAYDDLWAPGYLEACVGALDRQPDISLCHCIEIEIDESGNHLRTVLGGRGNLSSAYERFREFSKLDHDCEEMYGLMRSSVLRKTKLHQVYTDWDRDFICDVSLHGRFHYVQQPLFFRRVHASSSIKLYPNWRSRMLYFDPTAADRFVCPHWLQFLNYMRIIYRAPIKAQERLKCYAHMIRWLVLWKHGRWMVKDVILALGGVMRRTLKKARSLRSRPSNGQNLDTRRSG
jgi:glycosyltransferase involved in cell wall biosynthesis